MLPRLIAKRDGTEVPFDQDRIRNAIVQAQLSIGAKDMDLAEELAQSVSDWIDQHNDDQCTGIEDVQDAVVLVLQGSLNYELAQAYMRYRDARERSRRKRRVEDQQEQEHLNLRVLSDDGVSREWQRGRLQHFLRSELELSPTVAREVVLEVEANIAESDITVIEVPLLMSLVDAALVRCGCHSVAGRRAPLRIQRSVIDSCLQRYDDVSDSLVTACGHEVMRQWAVQNSFSDEVIRSYSKGRLWFDGLDDPFRGSQITMMLDEGENAWDFVTQAYRFAIQKRRRWQEVECIFPPLILAQLEKGDKDLAKALDTLGELATCFLACDGRTPLLDDWPLLNKNIGIATYTEDFLLRGRMQELGLTLRSGPHLMQPNYRRRVAVRLAINAQGLDGEYSQLDLLAMATVAAAKVRLDQLTANSEVVGAEVRFAIFGLPPNAKSLEYLERQVVQEGLRSDVALSRTRTLSPAACAHLHKLFD